MTGLDTNVVLRYILQDDPVQTRAATALIDNQLTPQDPGYISLAALLEVVWVLRSGLQWAEVAIADVVDQLLTTEVFVVQHERAVYRAASAVKREAAEFEDALIVGLGAFAGCEETVTFDRRASRLPGARRLI